jgi:uncharacterized membrane protein
MQIVGAILIVLGIVCLSFSESKQEDGEVY